MFRFDCPALDAVQSREDTGRSQAQFLTVLIPIPVEQSLANGERQRLGDAESVTTKPTP
jgi:hypothetical protein